MSTQDVLVLAEVQRDALSDIRLELLAAARGVATATGGQVIALVLSREGARFAAARPPLPPSPARPWKKVFPLGEAPGGNLGYRE